MTEQLIQWWRTLALRERRLISAAAGVIVLALVYLLLFEPAWKGRQQAARDLPRLRTQLAQIDALGVEAARLAALPVSNDSPQAIRQALESSVDAAGLKPYLSQLKLSGDVLDVRFKEVPFAAWIEWIDGAQRQTRLRVVDAAIQREAQIGRVSVKLSLEVPRREER